MLIYFVCSCDSVLLLKMSMRLPGVGDLDLLVARLTTEPRQRGMPWYKAANATKCHKQFRT